MKNIFSKNKIYMRSAKILFILYKDTVFQRRT